MDENELLTVTTTEAGLQVRGELDAGSSWVLRDQLDPLPQGDGGEVTVDMSGVSFVDSSGLRVLIDAHQRAERHGRSLVLLEPSTAVHRLLEISGLLGIIRVRPSGP